MTAPDPGLTDLIAAHELVSTDTIFHRNGMVQRPECKCGELMQWAGAYPAHLALVVEQHTTCLKWRGNDHSRHLAALEGEQQ